MVLSVDRIWEIMVEYGIATDDEIELVTYINGYSRNTLNDIIEVRTGYQNIEQWAESEGVTL